MHCLHTPVILTYFITIATLMVRNLSLDKDKGPQGSTTNLAFYTSQTYTNNRQ